MSQKQYHILEWLHALGVTLPLNTDTYNVLFRGWAVELCENFVFAGPRRGRYPMLGLRPAGHSGRRV